MPSCSYQKLMVLSDLVLLFNALIKKIALKGILGCLLLVLIWCVSCSAGSPGVQFEAGKSSS